MKILSVFILALVGCLIIVTAQAYHVLTGYDLIMMSLICLTALIGGLATGYIAINSEE